MGIIYLDERDIVCFDSTLDESLARKAKRNRDLLRLINQHEQGFTKIADIRDRAGLGDGGTQDALAAVRQLKKDALAGF